MARRRTAAVRRVAVLAMTALLVACGGAATEPTVVPAVAPSDDAPTTVADAALDPAESPMTEPDDPPARTSAVAADGAPLDDVPPADTRPDDAPSDEGPSDEAPPGDAPLAEVTSFSVTADGVAVTVISTGCTTRESLETRVERLDAETVELTVLRVKPDYCRRMPGDFAFELGRDELGIDDEDVVLRNPLVSLPTRGRG